MSLKGGKSGSYSSRNGKIQNLVIMSRTRIRYGGMIFAFCQKFSYSRVV